MTPRRAAGDALASPRSRGCRWSRALGAAAFLLAAGAAGAVTVQTFSTATQKEFAEGRAIGVRLGADGPLRLGPSLRQLAAIDEPIIWAVLRAADGATWIATGSGGRLLRLGAEGEPAEAARFPEIQVTALTADGTTVLAATSPEGAVYRVEADGKSVEVARPKAQYIWALARGRDGTVFAATGTEGIIYAIAAGETRVFADLPDLHVSSLIARDDGTLVAGTHPRGMVVRIGGDAATTVLYDSPEREVRALLAASDGSIYAAVNGGGPAEPPGGGRQSGVSVTVVAESEPAAVAPPPPPPPMLPPPESLGELQGEVMRIAVGRPPELVTRVKGEIIYALSMTPSGELLIGTSRRLLVPAAAEEADVLALAGEDAQVSCLGAPGGPVLVATSSPSRLSLLGAGGERTGTYTSKVFSAPGVARFGAVRVDGDVAPRAALRLETHSGDSEEPDASWSDWQPVELAGGAGLVASRAARFLQWRLGLTAGDGVAAPLVRSVAVSYLPQNQPAQIKSFVAHPPGVVFQVVSAGGVVEIAPPPLPSMFDELRAAKTEPPTGGKRLYKRGAQTLTWEVSDPNEDELHTRLAVRSREGSTWFVLRDRPDASSHTFDTQALPDGWYVARLEIDDAPSNPGDLARSASRQSQPFLVDNTPPRVQAIRSQVEGRTARVGFRGRDDLSALWKAEWSLDGAGFVPLFPADGIADSLEEEFAIEAPGLEPGEHVIVLRVHDQAGLSAAAHAPLEVR